ncbi:MAG: ABC transporter permease [Clostridia bacterium]|nr:ABC transporter permease [Clostridia bacterium]
MKNFKLLYTVGVILLSVLLTLGIASLILAVLGADVLKTFWVIFCYPFTTFKNISGVINIMTPLTLVGVGICVAYRSGIMNIGGEGQMLIGLLCAIVFALYSGIEGPLSIPLILLTGMIGGAVWGFFPGILKSKFGVSELLSTVMFNYIATQLYSYCLRVPLLDPAVAGGAGDPQTVKLAENQWLPRINEIIENTPKGTRFHTGILIALVLAVIVYLFMWKTPVGFKMRAAGASDRAARYGGISVNKYLVLAMLVSGACCGLAGTVEILGVHHRGLGNCTGGYGFSGIVVALFGGLHPLGVIPAAFFFALISFGCSALQINKIPVPSNVIDVLMGLVILVIVAAKLIIANPYLMDRTQRKLQSMLHRKEAA